MNRQELQSLKVVDLKDRLKQAGLPVSGRKDELVERLVSSVEGETSGGQILQQAPVEEPTRDAGEQDTAGRSWLAEAAFKSRGYDADGKPEFDLVDEPPRKRQRSARLDSRVPSDGAVQSANGNVLETGDAPTQVSDLYLDTVDRDRLDFDFERLCSVTLSNINIYACLVCGKYFQGRGKSSPAYAHSIGDDHHVFINLQSLSVYILPDSYEVSDPSLEDIKYLLNPIFHPDMLRRLDSGSSGPAYDLQSVPYHPGFVGLNNIKANDYLNVVVHALAHVVPLRNYFVFHSSTGAFERQERSELVKRFGMLLRKLWNPRAFKAHVSPHEFGQEVSNRSERRFVLTQQADPIAFLGWLLNTLHRDLGGTKRACSSIIYSAFQGEVRIDDQDVVAKPDSGEAVRPTFDISRDVRTTRSPFLFLAIDLPPPPVFQDAVEKNIIPQVSLGSVLAKYNGVTVQELPGKLRRHQCCRLPPFLILHVKRFTSNNFVDEKNPTILNFPTRGVSLEECLDRSQSDSATREGSLSQIYDMVANITYSSAAGTAKQDSQWKVQVHTRPLRDLDGNLIANDAGKLEEKWFQIQDLMVDEINRQMISLGESYLQVWERRGTPSDLPATSAHVNTSKKP